MKEYKDMTDKELVKAFWSQVEPLEAWTIAEHIKDEQLRRRMISEAKVWCQREEERDSYC